MIHVPAEVGKNTKNAVGKNKGMYQNYSLDTFYGKVKPDIVVVEKSMLFRH